MPVHDPRGLTPPRPPPPFESPSNTIMYHTLIYPARPLTDGCDEPRGGGGITQFYVPGCARNIAVYESDEYTRNYKHFGMIRGGSEAFEMQNSHCRRTRLLGF